MSTRVGRPKWKLWKQVKAVFKKQEQFEAIFIIMTSNKNESFK